LNCEKDSYVSYLTLGVEEDNLIRLYNVKSPVLVLKRQSKKETPIKSIQSLLIKKKGQKEPA
jgi:hypothetical protein